MARIRHSFIGAKIVLLILILGMTVLCATGCREKQNSIPDETGFFEIKGDGVAEATRLTLEELKVMEEGLVEDDYFSLNTYGSEQSARFKGIWVWYILQNSVDLQDEASTVRFIAEDGYQVEYTLEEAARDDYINEQNPDKKLKMILAWEENGRELGPDNGSALQLVVGQKEPGDVNKPYWVRNIRTIIIN